ncbi:MAG: 3-isopropylmalate dehydratase [Melioribacteraceae bacterium]|nr:3-isopropylmalate dehydratase [Melioribacteraceae bacterium]
MEKIIKGKAYVLGNNIDTDQIIPAEHLVYSTSIPNELKMYGHFALSGVPIEKAGLPDGNIPFIEDENSESEFSIIIAGTNFGCGSSREHAPLSLNVAGVKAIIAESYARIFYRNSVDGGFLIPIESINKLNDKIETGDELEIDIINNQLKNITKNLFYELKPLGSVFEIVESGGLFNYARKNKMI